MPKPSLCRSIGRSTAAFLIALSLSLHITLAVAQNSTSNGTVTPDAPPSNSTSQCQCGFLDPTTNALYSDSIIVYFNETNLTFPDNLFSKDSFEHKYEDGFVIAYREGAIAENVFYNHDDIWSWLTLNITGYSKQHLVNGAQLQTLRQDIRYGSFRVRMRSPAPYAGGSALTMKIAHNETSSAQLDLLNMDDSQDNARMTPVIGNMDPNWGYNVSYQTLEAAPYNIVPWDFWEYRMDWNQSTIAWYANDVMAHTDGAANASLTDLPTSFYLKHWSNGNTNYMQGPPANASNADINYIRLFFNSSIASESQMGMASCNAAQLCSTEDDSLRVTTPFTKDSTAKWAPTITDRVDSIETVGVIVMIASLALGLLLIAHALITKTADKKRRAKSTAVYRPTLQASPSAAYDRKKFSQDFEPQPEYEMNQMKQQDSRQQRASASTYLSAPGHTTPQYRRSMNSYTEKTLLDSSRRGSTLTASNASHNRESDSTLGYGYRPASSVYEIPGFDREDPFLATYYNPRTQRPSSEYDQNRTSIDPALNHRSETSPGNMARKPLDDQAVREIEPEGSAAAANPGAKPTLPAAALPQARTRVDYLAGLVAVCSLLVSCTHFILTFTPSVIEEYLDSHTKSESWARKTIEPFFFNDIWVGLFFTTSTRFLSSGYLRTGNLKVVAEKVVCRCPRLMIPITAVILFEYFLMDLGAVKYLSYIPSITWTTWVQTTVYPNFGWFLDETLQLFYLIPNAAPQLTYHYCTGVLWTIPVQLQNSWVVLLGAVVVREITTPWKRMAYYAFCVINSWYAQSWGSYFWMGLLLADLDITYKYRKWLHARPWAHYPILATAILLVLLSLGVDLVSIWTGWNFASEENAIHPEMTITALPVGEATYPLYFVPKLNGLIFAVCSQYIVEVSTWTQALLSTRVFLWLFPHVFTIYLIHGLIFWSIGSLVCFYFNNIGLSYSLNIFLTALISYTTLFACLPIVTPVMEMLGKEVTKGIWIGASQEPARWRGTAWPMEEDELRDAVYWRKDDEPDVPPQAPPHTVPYQSQSPDPRYAEQRRYEQETPNRF